jgi:hypothetical protein
MTATLAISAALHAQGITRRQAQAAIVGESPTMWSRYLNGHRSPQCAKVQAWMEAADAAGHTLHLTWDPHVGVVARGGGDGDP